MADPRTSSGDYGRFPESQRTENYINRNNFHSVNLTTICDHEMRFLDCYVGWPGSVHDSRVFKNSDFYQTVDNKFQDDSYLLGDSAYTLETWMMTPFKDHGPVRGVPLLSRCILVAIISQTVFFLYFTF